MTTARTPFEILGVSPDASANDLRRAHRRLALKYHPDRNPDDPAAKEAFLEVQTAYDALERADPDAGFDVERVAAQMQRAAQEAERRRSRPGEGGRAWQQVRFFLDRPRSEHAAAVLRTPSAQLGLAAAVVAAVALAVGLGPAVGVARQWLGTSVALSAWLASGIGVAVGLLVAFRTLTRVEMPPYAVETHWQGLRDLRWDVLLSWSEIRGVRQGDGAVDLALTDAAARRLQPLVPIHAWLQPNVYRLPMRDGSRLLPILQAQLKG